MMSDKIPPHVDNDPQETQEWKDAFQSVINYGGADRSRFLLKQLGNIAYTSGVDQPFSITTPYRNTILPADESPYPGDQRLERKIRSYIRWNAMAMVMRANQRNENIGGHISSFSSAATLYEVGFNHFFRAESKDHGGDLVFIQGHSAPGIYARSFIEHRFHEEHLERFRKEALEKDSLSSYPHPWLMPSYWQFPTVSMGLGPMQAIYQAYFMQYMHNRELIDMTDRKVWCFVGDGETDEPETLGSIALAGRENLDNLVFVVNCNLQRLDGPVRGNGKIIQELEGIFRGAGWNVIKLVWGGLWDPLLAKDDDGLLQKRMNECVDGEYQNCKSKGGLYTRQHFFGAYADLLKRVEHMTDTDIYRLNRGGHDPDKIYNAYLAAMEKTGKPTVILAKTVKGYGTGQSGSESHNTAHSMKKLNKESLIHFRNRFDIPVIDSKIESLPYFRPDTKSVEYAYLMARREALGGLLPSRRTVQKKLQIPGADMVKPFVEGSGNKEMSTTMAFVRILGNILRDKKIGDRIVPIVADEARTFGMEGMFRQLGIYTSEGQKYTPEDSEQVMYYREDKKGQIIECGISESGATSAWIAAGTSGVNNNQPMIPFYIFYSMFGFQRIGDFAWAAGDIQARGFLIGGTSGRTSLAGEGLQHLDGHSHLLANTVPNCESYDPAFSFELATIIQHGLQRMYVDGDNIYYYITTGNENYQHVAMPKGVEQGIIDGVYLLQPAQIQHTKKGKKVRLIASGAIVCEALKAAAMLEQEYDVAAEVWSATSFNKLVRNMEDCHRLNLLNPSKKEQESVIKRCFGADTESPIVTVTDYMKTYSSRIQADITAPYVALGTDGYGRSDDRANLRNFFEVDAAHITYAALVQLFRQDKLSSKELTKATQALQIDTTRENPRNC